MSPRPPVESAAATPPAEAGARWAMLGLLAIAELLGMSLWFAGNAAATHLSGRWSLDAAQIGWLTAVVQLGFVAGTACSAFLNLADVWSSRWLFAGSATLAAFSNLALLAAGGFAPALVTRFLTGFFLAGVYPPGMKMTATWFRTGRGLAIGILVGALCAGKAIPYLVLALGLPSLDFIFYTTSAGALLSAILVGALYRDGPFPFERRPFHWRLVAEAVRHRETRLAMGGYLGHMWELYAMWTWVPAFVAAGAAASRVSVPEWFPGIAAFWTLLAGGIGCVWGGWAAARLGYARVVTVAMAASGACCLGIGFLFGADPLWLMLALGVWGFFVVADSAQFSAMVTEVAPRHAVGTALTIQTSLGFLLTLATIQLIPVVVSSVGWRWAFVLLAPGPALGIAAIARLRAR